MVELARSDNKAQPVVMLKNRFALLGCKDNPGVRSEIALLNYPVIEQQIQKLRPLRKLETVRELARLVGTAAQYHLAQPVVDVVGHGVASSSNSTGCGGLSA